MIGGSGDYKVTKYHHGRGFNGHNVTHKHGGGRTHHASRVGKEGEMTIEHSEYLGDLVVSNATGQPITTTFASQSYGIQPGNASTFPWLSATAINFQNWDPEKIVFEYKPLVSEGTTAATQSLLGMGSVMMATRYDSVLGPYTNKQTMVESDYASSAKPSEHQMHAIECHQKYNTLGVMYTSSNTSLTVGDNGGDVRMQNLGIFQIASNGIPVGANTSISLGEIWVHYRIRCYKPILQAGLTNLLSSHVTNSASTGNIQTGQPFGALVTNAIQPPPAVNATTNLAQINTLTCTYNVNGTITFPLAVTEGTFLITYWMNGSTLSVAQTPPAFQNAQNGTIIRSWDVNTLTSVPVPNTNIQTNAISCSCLFSVNAPGNALASLQLVVTNPPQGVQDFDLYITPFNSAQT